MNKNLLMATAAAIIALLLIFVLIDDNEIDPNAVSIETLDKEQKTSQLTENTDITYTEKKSENVSVDKPEIPKKEKPKREKFVEYKTIDGNGKFEIALINPNQDLTKRSKEFIHVTGQIDGNSFSLKVPDYLLEEDTSSMTLRIKDRATDNTQSVSAFFLNDLSDTSQRHFVNINSKDIENIQYETKSRILPLPGSEVQ